MPKSSIFLSDKVKIMAVNTFRSQPTVNMDNDMVRLTIDMPRWIWNKNCKYLGVNRKGEPLGEDG